MFYSHYECLNICSSDQVFIDFDIANSGIIVIHPQDLTNVDICSDDLKKNTIFEQFIDLITDQVNYLKKIRKLERIIFIDLHYLPENVGIFNFYSKNQLVPFQTPEFFFCDMLQQQSKLKLDNKSSNCSKQLVDFLSAEIKELCAFQVCVPLDKSQNSTINYGLRAAIIATAALLQKG